jgi:valyl-tRNA synthetase
MEIPSKYNSKDIEEKTLKKWLEGDFFNANPSPLKKPFCIVIPPPNITGILHMGHALNNTIQDVLIRFKRMQGYESLWMPGTDHAGIATQNVVEKDLAKTGLRKEDIGREEFLKKLWQWTDKYGSTILGQLKKLGASCDWRRTRFTMDDEYSEAVKEVFIKLYEKGLIYRDNYIIHWCPHCKTALSDEEAPHKEIEGWLYYIRYPVRKILNSKSQIPNYIVVATTRPETMLGDTAVAINPDDERYEWLKEVKIILPIMERELKVIEDGSVSQEFGTGIVKVTPSHDPDDFILGKKHSLEFINIMNDDATLNENAGEFGGMDRYEAREAILELLEEKRLIEKKEPHKINAGHCYRCHTIIEPRVSLQWFVKMRPLAEAAIKAVEEGKINFYPERWKKDYLNWMSNIQDWCISRQIWWGHRLPVWQCKCQTAENSNSTHQGHNDFIVSREKPEKECPRCNYQYEQIPDVLDTWFSSWLWPFATFYWPSFGRDPRKEKDLDYFYPTSVLVTASEILFFWVARMIMAGLEFRKEIPFKDVLIHGTVRDERGIKMSKSLGNIIDPLEVIDKFGADALRFSLMLLASSGSDIYLSDDKFLVGRNFSNKIWNATRFLLLRIKENNFKIEDMSLKGLDEIDRWILRGLDETIEKNTVYLEEYRINEATKGIYDFFWHSFCDWYIEIIKDDFTVGRAKVLIYVLVNSMKLLHPVMPFITEEVFRLIGAFTSLNLEESITRSGWPNKKEIEIDDKVRKLQAIINTIGEMRNIKIDLGMGTKKIKLEVKTNDENVDFWKKHQSWVRRLALLESIELKEELKRVIYKNELWELNLGIKDIDANSFLSSLNKKIADLRSVFEKVTQRLKNDNFLRNAKEETVEEEKNKFQELSNRIARLEDLRNALK